MARSTRKADWQGMNWIRQDKRLAIYLRDGLACVWCGERSVEVFAEAVATYVNHGVTADAILDRIIALTDTPLGAHRTEAKSIMARRRKEA